MMEPERTKPTAEPGHAAPAPLQVRQLGTLEYAAAWDLQRDLVRQRQQEDIPDTLVLLQHPPTYTQGRRGDDSHLLVTAEELARLNIAFFHTDRGGDITYHGPGQIVGYPIIDLRARDNDVHRYVRSLEEVLIRTLADWGIDAARWSGFTGVWVGPAKIAAIGVKVSGGVTCHGFALNVAPDLTYFQRIVPCGLDGTEVTSMERLIGRVPAIDIVAERLTQHFSAVFGHQLAVEADPRL